MMRGIEGTLLAFSGEDLSARESSSWWRTVPPKLIAPSLTNLGLNRRPFFREVSNLIFLTHKHSPCPHSTMTKQPPQSGSRRAGYPKLGFGSVAACCLPQAVEGRLAWCPAQPHCWHLWACVQSLMLWSAPGISYITSSYAYGFLNNWCSLRNIQVSDILKFYHRAEV